MPYIARTIGWWDWLGHTWCAECTDPETLVDADEIYADNSAAQGVECDGCGKVLPFDPTDLVQVSR